MDQPRQGKRDWHGGVDAGQWAHRPAKVPFGLRSKALNLPNLASTLSMNCWSAYSGWSYRIPTRESLLYRATTLGLECVMWNSQGSNKRFKRKKKKKECINSPALCYNLKVILAVWLFHKSTTKILVFMIFVHDIAHEQSGHGGRNIDYPLTWQHGFLLIKSELATTLSNGCSQPPIGQSTGSPMKDLEKGPK